MPSCIPDLGGRTLYRLELGLSSVNRPKGSVSPLAYPQQTSCSNRMELKTTLSDSFFNRFCPDPTVMLDLGDIYAEFNARFFNGKLPILAHKLVKSKTGETRRVYNTLKWDGRLGKTTLGRYKLRNGHGEIRLSRSIAHNPTLTKSVLLHEMVHKYLDLTGQDDGIMGHGENFILTSKRINEQCEEKGFAYRVHFYDEEITKEEPQAFVDLIGKEIYLGKDLDVARKMKSILNSAFDHKYDYVH